MHSKALLVCSSICLSPEHYVWGAVDTGEWRPSPMDGDSNLTTQRASKPESQWVSRLLPLSWFKPQKGITGWMTPGPEGWEVGFVLPDEAAHHLCSLSWVGRYIGVRCVEHVRRRGNYGSGVTVTVGTCHQDCCLAEASPFHFQHPHRCSPSPSGDMWSTQGLTGCILSSCYP